MSDFSVLSCSVDSTLPLGGSEAMTEKEPELVMLWSRSRAREQWRFVPQRRLPRGPEIRWSSCSWEQAPLWSGSGLEDNVEEIAGSVWN